ncbi:GNAT family N-acetyltransferase [Deinococcus cellulosilyticus]|uniref:N-acetyltransferase domain-containing protein n=1 Tax=Deinococcus cellulosilyticus (strain DSM 18568 / NBRC 106333 / KACC 11606 / 5516J-15) TaxID=1223518 RepID=A0A511N3D3_DEIC1|nr:GNAT family N-acetyltransferase [Deinococcus cellulosilyticus]GEM47374.1 hypothetical protein DC3_30090 [Deinococcus cellulosilyticus NBRC 106333 = KACC 11606]
MTHLETKLAQLSPLLHQWYTPEKLKHNLEEALQVELDRLQNLEFAKDFHDHCQVPGSEPADYLNRWMGETLIGIRFRALDLSRPFVDVILMPQLPGDAAGFLKVARQAATACALFQPKHARFFVPSHIDLGPLPEGFFWEKRYLALPIQEARQLPLPSRHGDITLQRPAELDFYEAYTQIYQDIAAVHPDHPEYATPESREDLQDLLEEGTLYQVMHEDQWIGVVAATRSAEEGLSGFVVTEMLLRPEFQGRGLGAAAQRHLIENLPALEDDVLFGTIDSRNTSAIRAALKNHRKDIGGYLWVKV